MKKHTHRILFLLIWVFVSQTTWSGDFLESSHEKITDTTQTIELQLFGAKLQKLALVPSQDNSLEDLNDDNFDNLSEKEIKAEIFKTKRQRSKAKVKERKAQIANSEEDVEKYGEQAQKLGKHLDALNQELKKRWDLEGRDPVAESKQRERETWAAINRFFQKQLASNNADDSPDVLTLPSGFGSTTNDSDSSIWESIFGTSSHIRSDSPSYLLNESWYYAGYTSYPSPNQ